MDQLNVKRPSIEPLASGHIIEQIEMIKKILAKGFAYEINGSVYFDVKKYNDKFAYGKLSGRVLEDLLSNTRVLEGQDEKHNSYDFALWKKAQPEHIMRWPSPWSDGFPGWHAECSAMSAKYLGEHFDIHGGGMDLLFPHHESEIAQSQVANNCEPCKYWMHNNMITINGQKMGKSLGNFITLNDFFTGNHPSLEKAYSPMCIRFFILQAHYRSTLDFSNEALLAAEKGLKRLMQGIETLQKIKPSATSSNDISKLSDNCYEAMDDDFNSPIVIANLFEGLKIINSINDGKESISEKDLESLKNLFNTFVFEILGLTNETDKNQFDVMDGLMQMVLSFRQQAKINKDYSASDKIRDELLKLGIVVKDGKEGSVWTLE
jgi:cysteinyl-tRNA synthetase